MMLPGAAQEPGKGGMSYECLRGGGEPSLGRALDTRIWPLLLVCVWMYLCGGLGYESLIGGARVVLLEAQGALVA